MIDQLVRGAGAGAIGTLALNASTYLDVTLRGRPPSSLPSKAVGRLADIAGVDLSDEGPDSVEAQNRRSGLGALLGYATGISVGVLYGVVRPRTEFVPLPVAGLAAGAVAMAASDSSLVASGTTDPCQWALSGWLADVIPHAVYGLATAAVFEALTRSRTEP